MSYIIDYSICRYMSVHTLARSPLSVGPMGVTKRLPQVMGSKVTRVHTPVKSLINALTTIAAKRSRPLVTYRSM